MLKRKINIIKEWSPIIALSLAVFIFGTSEFSPIGLLPNIAKAISETETRTGLILTIYAWTVAITALPITILTSNIERKKLIILAVIIFTLGNFFVATSESFSNVAISRIIVAISHAIFWSITPPLAYRISPNGKSTYGLAIISAGAVSAAILGIPFCKYIGNHFSWNSAFYLISISAFFIIFLLYFILPNTPATKTERTKALSRVFKNKLLLIAFTITVLFITGHFTIFTYLSPLLNKISQFTEDSIAIIFLVYGAIGTLGILIATKFMEEKIYKILLFGTITTIFLFMTLEMISSNKILIIFFITIWGIIYSMMFLSLQGWIIKIANKDSDIANSIRASMFNIGVGLGALNGGFFIDKYKIENIGYMGAIIITIPIIIIIYLFNIKPKKL